MIIDGEHATTPEEHASAEAAIERERASALAAAKRERAATVAASAAEGARLRAIATEANQVYRRLATSRAKKVTAEPRPTTLNAREEARQEVAAIRAARQRAIEAAHAAGLRKPLTVLIPTARRELLRAPASVYAPRVLTPEPFFVDASAVGNPFAAVHSLARSIRVAASEETELAKERGQYAYRAAEAASSAAREAAEDASTIRLPARRLP